MVPGHTRHGWPASHPLPRSPALPRDAAALPRRKPQGRSGAARSLERPDDPEHLRACPADRAADRRGAGGTHALRASDRPGNTPGEGGKRPLLRVERCRRNLDVTGLSMWSRRPDSNRRPADYESAALPTELRRRSWSRSRKSLGQQAARFNARAGPPARHEFRYIV